MEQTFFLFSHFHMTEVTKCHLNQKKSWAGGGLNWTPGPILASSRWQTNQVDKAEEEGSCDGSGSRQRQEEKRAEKTDK